MLLWLFQPKPYVTLRCYLKNEKNGQLALSKTPAMIVASARIRALQQK